MEQKFIDFLERIIFDDGAEIGLRQEALHMYAEITNTAKYVPENEATVRVYIEGTGIKLYSLFKSDVLEIQEYLRAGQKINAIRVLRQAILNRHNFNILLKDAKTTIDNWTSYIS